MSNNGCIVKTHYNYRKCYSSVLMTFKAVNNNYPPYLLKQFTLLQNPEGVTTRGNAQKKLCVNKVCNKYNTVKNATKIIYQLNFVLLNLWLPSNPK